jgi:iron-sulfur cluster repair protein YtfE (RIC family)
MMHPTAQAVDYIWDYFSHTYFSEETRNVIREVEKINAMQAHRPIKGADTEGVKKFKQTLALRIKELEMKFPVLQRFPF